MTPGVLIRKHLLLLTLTVLALAWPCAGQGVKRIIVIKLDGVPGYYIDEYVKKHDPRTGVSMLPWFEEVFYKNGTRVPNFYSRGMSLSGPAWGQIDTGQHLQIKGNVEYDRYTLRTYDYLGVIPYFTRAAFKEQVDTPAMEVLDQIGIPILQDAFPYEREYTANQLYQRGINWAGLAGGFLNAFPRSGRDLVDEWTMGFDLRDATIDQNERDIIGKLSKRPEIDYFDYYNGSFDHASHHYSNAASRLAVLKKIDQTIGRIWQANKASARGPETAIVVVSDHGFNSEDGVYSQGFNLVRLLGSTAGGGHHVVTKRRLMLDYSIKGLNPYVPIIKTQSNESYYLRGRNEEYPTALLDFDGNERSSVHLRNSDLNVLQILLQQIKSGKLDAVEKRSVTNAFLGIIDRNRSTWQTVADQLEEELGALHRFNLEQARVVAALPTKFSQDDIALGKDKAARRIRAQAALSREDERSYGAYLASLNRILSLRSETFDPSGLREEDVIPPGAMGERNSLYQLQNYVVGLSQNGITIDADGGVDMEKSFARVNYFDLLKRQKVRNKVQAKVSDEPIDFIAARIPSSSLVDALGADANSAEDAIWLFGGPDKQALILTRRAGDGELFYRYLPVAGLFEDEAGKVHFQPRSLDEGFPLKMFEDPKFSIPADQRASWVSSWHTELEWLRAAHRSAYSDAVIALNEQMDDHPLPDQPALSDDDRLIRRFRIRQRHLTAADILILASDHWNFDVRGFNPGGNHGSFFRVSTNSTFLLAGGDKTGIPRGLEVQEPYDSLSVMPTIMALMGKTDANNEPNSDLRALGFRRFPGRVVREVLGR